MQKTDEIGLNIAATFDESLTELPREGSHDVEMVDAKSVVPRLESIVKDEPVVLLIFGTIAGNQKKGEARYMLREVRQLVTYRSRLFKRVEKDCQDQKAEAARQRETEEKKQRRKAAIQAEAARIKAERYAEDQAWQDQFQKGQETNHLREAENNLIARGLLEPKKSEKSGKKSNETVEVSQ